MAPPDWKLCALCQKISKEKLTCPDNSGRKSTLDAGYITLTASILKFA
jgi:hypothetical protein